MADLSLSIDEVFGWPVSIIIESPEGEVIVEDDWIAYIRLGYCFFDIVFDLFECKLRSMDPDDDKSLVSVFLIPCSKIRERPLTVDTRVCPEIYDHDFSLEAHHGERIGVDPVRERYWDIWSLSWSCNIKFRLHDILSS